MKKRVILLILSIFLMLSACKGDFSSPTAPREVSGNSSGLDAQNRYMRFAFSSFQEADRFFIGSDFMDSFLRYYDKESGISGVLCADPTCAHNSSDCGAHLKLGASAFLYDGKVYYISNDLQSGDTHCIFRKDLSGRNQELVKRIPFDEVVLPYQPQQYALHRGRLYIRGGANVIVGPQTGHRISLISSPLDSSEDFTVLYDQTFYNSASADMRLVGENAYLSIVAGSEADHCGVTVLKFNAVTGASETMLEEAEIAAEIGPFWVTDQGEIYLPGYQDGCAFLWKIENGKRTEIASWESRSSGAPDIYDGIVLEKSLEDNVRRILILDLSGETVYDGPLFTEAISELPEDPNSYGLGVIGGDTGKLILNLFPFMNKDTHYYTIMLDLHNNLKPTLLWSSGE